MLWTTILLQLALWVTSIQAFFPWFPNENGESGNIDAIKKSSRRADADGRVAEVRDASGQGLTLPLKQRKASVRPLPYSQIPCKTLVANLECNQSDQPRGAQVAQAADRLARKYAPAGVSKTREASSHLDKRQNQFKIVTAAVPTQSNSAGIAQDGGDISYFVQVGVGSKQTPMYMLLDSGAGTTWVMGSSCQTPACTMHSRFGPSDSTSLVASTKTFSIAYGSGKVVGSLASDTLSVAGMKATMSFGVADTTSDDFEHFPFDGILGLSMAKGATDNFLDMVKSEKLIGANMFAVSLNRNSDGPNNGEITFGATNPAKFTGDISYTPVSSDAHGDWAIPLDDFEFDGNKAGITGKLAYIDTGTSYVFGPSSDVAALHKQIPGAKSGDGVTYTVPCDNNKPITVIFSGVKYAISAKEWHSGPNGNGDCTSNIYGHEVVKGQWLLGDLFLKNVYAVFDMDQTRIGEPFS